MELIRFIFGCIWLFFGVVFLLWALGIIIMMALGMKKTEDLSRRLKQGKETPDDENTK